MAAKQNRVASSFNRTILELKYDYYEIDEAALLTFNRTILELKYVLGSAAVDGTLTFNRTILELKFLGYQLAGRKASSLLIAPYWN